MIRMLFAILLFTIIFLYIALLNPQSVSVKLTRSISYDVPFVVIAVVLVMIGFIGAYLFTFLKGIKWALSRMKDKKHIKQQQDKLALLWKAFAFCKIGDSEKAFDLLKRASLKGPFSTEVLAFLGHLNREKGNKEEALLLHKRAAREKEDELLLYEMYLDYVALGEWKNALEILQKLIKKIKPNIALYKEFVKVYKALGDYENAYKAQEKVIKLASEDKKEREKNTLAALAFEEAKEKKDASKLKFIIKRYPGFIPAYLTLLEIENKDKKIASLLERACEKTPHPVLLERLERIYISQESPEAMINFYQKLRSIHPNEKLIPFMWAGFCLSLGMYKDARELALSLNGEEKSLKFLKARILERTGEKEEALKVFEETLELVDFTYRCDLCKGETDKWSERCPFCQEWNSLRAILK